MQQSTFNLLSETRSAVDITLKKGGSTKFHIKPVMHVSIII